MEGEKRLARIAGVLYLGVAVLGDSPSLSSETVFFGLWLLPLGYLVVKSGWFPTWIGVLLIAGCFGYLVDTFATFLAPVVAETIEAIVVAPAAIGELSLVAYLLIKGVRDREEQPRALAPVAS